MIKIEAFFSSVTFRFIGHSLFIYSLKMSWCTVCENSRRKLNLRGQCQVGMICVFRVRFLLHSSLNFFSSIKGGTMTKLRAFLPYISQTNNQDRYLILGVGEKKQNYVKSL